jgi:hypothetical protein
MNAFIKLEGMQLGAVKRHFFYLHESLEKAGLSRKKDFWLSGFSGCMGIYITFI